MGSNMMRQAVPLLKPENLQLLEPVLEEGVVTDSRLQINAEADGVIEFVDANEIVISYDRTEDEEFVSFEDNIKGTNFQNISKTNQNTCVNLTPMVRKGQKG